MMNKIVVDAVSKAFGSRAEQGLKAMENGSSKEKVQAELGVTVGVRDVSFSVAKGETFVLMGLSGSGKSTLLRLLNRLHEPTRGSIHIDGVDITKLSKSELIQIRRKKFCGMVFQQFAILPHRTILGNVEFGLEIQGVPAAKRQDRAREMIDLVGLKGNETSYPDQLSGGMQQRVGLARALAVEADILLMDEAFSALDPLIRREMQDQLIEIQASMHKTIVFVTHDLNEAIKLGDRIAILKDGGVVQLGTAEEIVTNPADEYVAEFVRDVDRAGFLKAGAEKGKES